MKYIKKILAVLSTVAIVASLAACGSSGSAGTSSAAASAGSTSASGSAVSSSTRKTLIVGFDAEYPPYGYMDDNGQYVGFDLDLAQEVCNRNGWELVKQPIDWDSKDMELNSGNIDVIWNGFTMTGREDKYTWVGPYVDNSIVFVVMADSDIQSAADLAGKAVVTQSGSSALTALTDDPGDGSNDENLTLAKSFSTLDQVPDYNTAFMNLESGVDQAVAVDIGVAKYQLESRGDTFRMLEKPLSTEQYGIGFKLGNTELADQVKASLDAMMADGTFMKIADQWGLSDMICYGK